MGANLPSPAAFAALVLTVRIPILLSSSFARPVPPAHAYLRCRSGRLLIALDGSLVYNPPTPAAACRRLIGQYMNRSNWLMVEEW
ncbi:hypothetical protein DM02DRAFT_608349 [Periconia macrospinosa]|uniref:Secreted protein n=1 Tax=Periconia macrospinosa TaxID=97972 RepID=A0A2V1EEC8_9PLEO|nr:hypothetical protein DM02DRAFT_608147 [Periconia macrospinosa]PVI08291.1 hypothetical protein DM02DRAFT_608349 [Periconia macrospinosa]